MITNTFLGLDFWPLRMEDQAHIEPILQGQPQPLSGYTFSILCAWAKTFSYEWTQLADHTLLITSLDPDVTTRYMLQPQGAFTEQSQELLLQMFRGLSYPMKIIAVNESFIDKHAQFCSHFEVQEFRDHDNYLYAAEDLATLAGRRYAKKRNLIAQADSLYPWIATELSSNDFLACLHVITHNPGRTQREASVDYEKASLTMMMSNFERLHQRGTLIKVDDEPIAFSMWEPLSADTAVIHMEKTDHEFKGIAQIINRETAKAIQSEGFEWINREQDLGLPGLRQAKLSYYPRALIKYYVLTLK